MEPSKPQGRKEEEEDKKRKTRGGGRLKTVLMFSHVSVEPEVSQRLQKLRRGGEKKEERGESRRGGEEVRREEGMEKEGEKDGGQIDKTEEREEEQM